MADNQADTTKRTGLYIVALVLVFVSVVGSISWVSTRPGVSDSTVIISGIVALATPTIAAVLALMQGLQNSAKTERVASQIDDTHAQLMAVNAKVDGQLSKLVEAATNPQSNVIIPPVPPIDPASGIVKPSG